MLRAQFKLKAVGTPIFLNFLFHNIKYLKKLFIVTIKNDVIQYKQMTNDRPIHSLNHQ